MDKLFKECENMFMPEPLVDGRLNVGPVEQIKFGPSDSDRRRDTNVYEQDYVRNEMKKYANYQAMPMNENDRLSIVDSIGTAQQSANDTYYQHNYKFRTNSLPIDFFKEKIINTVESSDVVIIRGDTGCGKTTQVPQFILDDAKENDQWCNIAVTQPRKIAAINIAQRVSEERGWPLGSVVGYQVGLEKMVNANTLVTYMTTGVLLQKLIKTKNLHSYTHIIIDEIHERTEELDLLLIVVRKFLFTNSPHTKVILMSATIEAEHFTRYFAFNSNLNRDGFAPVVNITKKSEFTKQIFYVDQIAIVKKVHQFDIDKPEINEMWNMFTFLLTAFDKLDDDPNGRDVGNVLVFLPGLNEIEEAMRRMSQVDRSTEAVKWEAIPLHSSLPNDEQAKVFKTPKPHHRKVILSTNIAESSITVSDIKFVIDFCLTKNLVVDPMSKFSSLQLEWASHVNCEQRAGRVGRVSNGRIYRLVTREFYERYMPATPTPEILRAPLENIVLKAKELDMHDTPSQILALAMNPPNLRNIENTIWNLKEVGGLLQTCRGVRTNADGDLTFMGSVMAGLPLDVHLSKLILLGHMFSCLEEAIIIAAGLSIPNIFVIPFQDRFLFYQKLLMWSDGCNSDQVTLLNLHNVWSTMKREKRFKTVREEAAWCRHNFVSFKGMKEWTTLISEIKIRLGQYHIRESHGKYRVELGALEKPTILKVIMCGAFYPNYFLKKEMLDEREAVRAVCGKDPTRTVYFQGFDNRQPGQLYVKQIKKWFSPNDQMQQSINVIFDNSYKIYVEFKRKTTDQVTLDLNGRKTVTDLVSKIPIEMYECIRKRQLKYPFKLHLYSLSDALEFAEKFCLNSSMNAEVSTSNPNLTYDPIPTLDVEMIQFTITYGNDAGHFFVQLTDDETQRLSAAIERELNSHVLHPTIDTLRDPKKFKFDDVYAARWNVDNKFYRCKVATVLGKHARVLFIDFGNTQDVFLSEIYNLPAIPLVNTPPLMLECVLAGVKPCPNHSQNGKWSNEANQYVFKKTSNVVLYGEVYSVVDDVVHLNVYYGRTDRGACLNRELIEMGYGIEVKESYLSQEDHKMRQAVKASNDPAPFLQIERMKKRPEVEAPADLRRYERTIDLKGPFSPLEMRVGSTLVGARAQRVDMEGQSVNAVLLDSEADDPHSILLVANKVMQSANGGLRLRESTLMPRIPGLPALMAMLFCPQMEPKLTSDGTRVASILCGMGCREPDHLPMHPAHDMVIQLDTVLLAEEIDLINNVRYLMNYCIKVMDSNYFGEDNSNKQLLFDSQKKIIDALFRCLYHKRKSMEKVYAKYASEWNKSEVDACVLETNMVQDPEDIWPLLKFLELKTLPEGADLILNNLDELFEIARSEGPPKSVMCLLCNERLIDAYDVRNHIVSSGHIANKRKFDESLRNWQACEGLK